MTAHEWLSLVVIAVVVTVACVGLIIQHLNWRDAEREDRIRAQMRGDRRIERDVRWH